MKRIEEFIESIEDLVYAGVKDFSKLRLVQLIDTIIEKTNFEDVCRMHESFAKVVVIKKIVYERITNDTVSKIER